MPEPKFAPNLARLLDEADRTTALVAAAPGDGEHNPKSTASGLRIAVAAARPGLESRRIGGELLSLSAPAASLELLGLAPGFRSDLLTLLPPGPSLASSTGYFVHLADRYHRAVSSAEATRSFLSRWQKNESEAPTSMGKVVREDKQAVEQLALTCAAARPALVAAEVGAAEELRSASASARGGRAHSLVARTAWPATAVFII